MQFVPKVVDGAGVANTEQEKPKLPTLADGNGEPQTFLCEPALGRDLSTRNPENGSAMVVVAISARSCEIGS